jgi:hypothetical protein
MRPRQLETKMCTYTSFPRAAGAGSRRAAVGGSVVKSSFFIHERRRHASLRFTQMPRAVGSFSKFVATSLSAVHDLLTLFAPDAHHLHAFYAPDNGEG